METRWDISHLRTGAAVTGALAVVGVPLGWVARGPAGALWVAIGLLIVAAFFTVSTLAVAWAGRRSDSLTLPVALATYVGKILILGAIMLAVRGRTWLEPEALGWAVFAGTVGWTVAHARRVWTSPMYYVTEPDPAPRLANEGQ